MANSTPAGIKVEYDNVGGTPVDISQFVLSIGEISVESAPSEGTMFRITLPTVPRRSE